MQTTQDINVATVVSDKKTNLPLASEVDPDKNPIMSDFVRGSLTYKWNKNLSEYGFFYAIMINEKDLKETLDGKYENSDKKRTIYVSKYIYGQKYTYPIIGSTIYEFAMNKETAENINKFVNNMSSNRVFKEDGWKMAIVSSENIHDPKNKNQNYDYTTKNGSTDEWAGLNFSKVVQDENRPLDMYKVVYGDFGWPTEWLRKEPYNKNMKLEGYNVNDPFWDRYNIGSTLTYVKKNNENVKLKVKVVQLDSFEFTDPKTERKFYLKEKDLERYADIEGWIRK